MNDGKEGRDKVPNAALLVGLRLVELVAIALLFLLAICAPELGYFYL